MTYVATRQAATSSPTASSLTTTSSQTSKTQDLAAHELVDNGAGSFGAWGSVNYVGKSITVRLVNPDTKTDSYSSDHEDASVFNTLTVDDLVNAGGGGSSSAKGGTYGSSGVSEQIVAGGAVQVSYSTGFGGSTTHTQTVSPGALTIDLCPLTSDAVVPGSVQFVWMGHTYTDFEGVIYRGRTGVSAGTVSGTMDYVSGLALMTDYVVGPNPESLDLQSLWTRRQAWKAASVFFRTAAAPVKPGGFVMTILDAAGNSHTVTGGLDGLLTGAHVKGRMDYQFGIGEVQFGDFVLDSALTAEEKAQWWYTAADVGAVEAGKIWRPMPVDPSSLRFNLVTYFYLPLEADVLGLDPVRLPQDGRVPKYRRGGYVVVSHAAQLPPAALSAGQTIDCGRTRLSRVHLIGHDNNLIYTGYQVDLDAGLVEILDVTGWSQPVSIEHRIEEMARVRDLQIDGTLELTKTLSHAFPIGSVVSSAIMAGDLEASVVRAWDQGSWDKVSWLDVIDGPPAPGTYSRNVYPLILTNDGALAGRYAFHFTSSNNFEFYSEELGLIATGSKDVDFAPINPISGAPLMFVDHRGWGGGWVQGNAFFVHLSWAGYTYAAVRTVQPSEAAGTDYSFELHTRGGVDRP